MAKIVRLTENDLIRIVKKVIKEQKYASFDDENWYDEEDFMISRDKMGDDEDYDTEEFDDFESFNEKHPPMGDKWLGGTEKDRKFQFNKNKRMFDRPLKIKTRKMRD